MSKHVGSRFEDFLASEGILEYVQLLAVKKVIAQVFRKTMERERVTRSALARRMQTSRTLVNRLLDPTDTGVTLATLSKASRELYLELLVSLAARRAKRSARR